MRTIGKSPRSGLQTSGNEQSRKRCFSIAPARNRWRRFVRGSDSGFRSIHRPKRYDWRGIFWLLGRCRSSTRIALLWLVRRLCGTTRLSVPGSTDWVSKSRVTGVRRDTRRGPLGSCRRPSACRSHGNLRFFRRALLGEGKPPTYDIKKGGELSPPFTSALLVRSELLCVLCASAVKPFGGYPAASCFCCGDC
jgi:hypothetical protein